MSLEENGLRVLGSVEDDHGTELVLGALVAVHHHDGGQRPQHDCSQTAHQPNCCLFLLNSIKLGFH